jgi:hypothetical protein
MRWKRTGQFDHAEMQAAKSSAAAVTAAVTAITITAAVAVTAFTASDAYNAAYYILQGRDAEARSKLVELRQKLTDLGVDVAALEAQSGAAVAAPRAPRAPRARRAQ